MKEILVASFDLEVGGVERSLISMLDHFDYEKYKLDVMLYRHQGDFMEQLSDNIHLLDEIAQYATFRKSIKEIMAEGNFYLGGSRIISKIMADMKGKLRRLEEPGYQQMQLMWKYALPFLPKINKKYDVAISYLWPHYFVAEKVQALTKIAWIHTDYATVETDIKMDLQMWDKFDHIMAVSEACRVSFLKKYPELTEKVEVLENITAPELIRSMAKEQVQNNPMKDDSRFKLVTVARLSHAKGIDQAVRALKLVKDRGYENIAWYVVGYGGEEGMIRDLIAEYGLTDDFILLGKQTNPYPFMKAADLYVQPSRYEGKAVTVGEAQILGKPVLITNYPTACSQVTYGVDGMICDLSVEGIADGVKKLIDKDELRKKITLHIRNVNYSNETELEKIYTIIDG